MTTTNNQKGRKWLVLMLMILSMCTIYILPYLRYNLFTPLQEAMGLAGETEKYGNLVSVYGIMNVLMYLPGGIIADLFDPKKLMVFSMISSGALGLWMATWPGYEMLLIIHILWGVTTVLTFWSSSVK
ncbi:MAG: MFS transporter, partial [Lachnospiraceae bacterium]